MEYKEGNKIKFSFDPLPYKIMAADERYIIASRKFNKKRDWSFVKMHVEMGSFMTLKEAYEYSKPLPIYTIADLQEKVCGPDNLVFGIHDYFSTFDCRQAIIDLHEGKMEISKRHMVELNIEL